MERYATAFHQPPVADLSNHGTWVEAGSQTAKERATAVWTQRLAAFTLPVACDGVQDRLAGYIARRTAAGGAAPEE